MMRKIELDGTREFNPLGMKAIVLHDSEHFKILNFNLKAGALFPIQRRCVRKGCEPAPPVRT